jgi:hypothetical protein
MQNFTSQIDIARSYQTSLDNYNKAIANIQKSTPQMLQARAIKPITTAFTNYVTNLKKQAPYANLLLRPTKALLCGLNYGGTPYELVGCVNDMHTMETICINKGFSVKTLQEPGRQTILEEFKALLQSSRPNDMLVFTYSGHGTDTIDRNNDELTGRDQMIVASDLLPVADDELKALIMKYLHPQATLFAMFDSCFSGSVLDLRFSDQINGKEAITPGQVVMISGCRDDQTSADTYEGNKFCGAMTWAYSSTTSPSSWQDLITKMRASLKNGKYTQIPQISSGKTLNMNELPYL